MSYMGVKLKHYGYEISIKLHGPFDEFPISPKEVKDCVSVLLDSTRITNIVQLANMLASYMCDVFCDSDKILWTQIDIETLVNGIQYGTSADKVNDEYLRLSGIS